MFLTIALLRNKIPGSQWIGKHKRPRFVSAHMKNRMIRKLEIEAENEYWLSQPYMTKEQDYGHNREGRQAYFKALVTAAKSKFPEHRYAAEHLGHLNVTKKWTSS
ncbi:large ribosomal subunit protein mL63 [Anolis sagrei]|uniref:large ribosomal subunit protein mL63 n=1 Tax=Anolis sagrei TaxID=38937 RepID=UPI003521D56F